MLGLVEHGKSCITSWTVDHIAGDHIHTDITTCNIEKPEQKYRVEKVRHRLLEKYHWQLKPV